MVLWFVMIFDGTLSGLPPTHTYITTYYVSDFDLDTFFCWITASESRTHNRLIEREMMEKTSLLPKYVINYY